MSDTHDLNGRPWALYNSLKPGDIIEVDGDFTCLAAGSKHIVFENNDGVLYINCGEGEHCLNGQCDDERGILIGCYACESF